MQDPLSAHFPSRTQLDEEEEEELRTQAWSEEFATIPNVEWTPATQSLLQEGKLRTSLLVLATNAAACTLLEQCLQHAELLGSMQQPDILLDALAAVRNLYKGSTGKESQSVLCKGPGGTVVALCRGKVTPERAAAFVNGLFEKVHPGHVICASGLPAHQFLGEQDSTQQPQHFVVETSAAHSQLPHSIPRLPSGNLVSGLPAAVASHCQVHGVPATLLLSVDATPFPDSIAMCALANALASLLRHTGACNLGDMLIEPDTLATACKQMRKAVQSSDRAAMYM